MFNFTHNLECRMAQLVNFGVSYDITVAEIPSAMAASDMGKTFLTHRARAMTMGDRAHVGERTWKNKLDDLHPKFSVSELLLRRNRFEDKFFPSEHATNPPKRISDCLHIADIERKLGFRIRPPFSFQNFRRAKAAPPSGDVGMPRGPSGVRREPKQWGWAEHNSTLRGYRNFETYETRARRRSEKRAISRQKTRAQTCEIAPLVKPGRVFPG